MNAWDSDLTLQMDIECDKSTSFVSDLNHASQPYDLVSLWNSLVEDTHFTCSLVLAPYDSSDTIDSSVFSVPLRCSNHNHFPLPQLSSSSHIMMLANCYWSLPKENEVVILPIKFPTMLIEADDDHDEVALQFEADLRGAKDLFIHHFYYAEDTASSNTTETINATQWHDILWIPYAITSTLRQASFHWHMTDIIEATMIILALLIVFLLLKDTYRVPAYPRTSKPQSIRRIGEESVNASGPSGHRRPLTYLKAKQPSSPESDQRISKAKLFSPQAQTDFVQEYWGIVPE